MSHFNFAVHLKAVPWKRPILGEQVKNLEDLQRATQMITNLNHAQITIREIH